MFTTSASFYDELYSFRDLTAEASRIEALLEAHAKRPIQTVLEIGCATGEIAARLVHRCDVTAVDLDSELLALARSKYPSMRFEQADMCDLNLDRRFDAIVCVYGVVAYARTRPRLRLLAEVVARHLEPGGVGLLQPWHFPERYDGAPQVRAVDLPAVKIARMSVGTIHDGEVTLDIQYLVTQGGRIDHCVEAHHLGLFSDREHREALTTAGLKVAWEPNGPGTQGIYVVTPERPGLM